MDEILGRGMGFPVRPAPRGGLWVSDDREKVRQSIWLILATAPGERAMRPEFGCAIHDLVFWPNTEALRGLATEKVREALVRWEPRIDVIDIRAETDRNKPNRLLIRLDYRLRQNNAFDNLVYPFFLEEGGTEQVS